MVKAVFIHIPKTAGSSFRNVLERGFGADAVSPSFPAFRMTREIADGLSHYAIIQGHISIEDVRTFFPGALMFTIVRDPIDRCVSWYYYARTVGPNDNTDVIAAQTQPLDAFFASDREIIFRNIYNRHVRQLGDHVSNVDVNIDLALASAKETLAECCWVGRQETLDEDFGALARIFPELAGIDIPRHNVTNDRRPLADISARTLDAIRSLNEYDAALLEAYYP